MCLVSNISDYGRTIPIDTWTIPGWSDYNELMEKARKWDELMKQKDCESESKTAWMEEVEKRLKRLEKNPKKKDIRIKFETEKGG